MILRIGQEAHNKAVVNKQATDSIDGLIQFWELKFAVAIYLYVYPIQFQSFWQLGTSSEMHPIYYISIGLIALK